MIIVQCGQKPKLLFPFLDHGAIERRLRLRVLNTGGVDTQQHLFPVARSQMSEYSPV